MIVDDPFERAARREAMAKVAAFGAGDGDASARRRGRVGGLAGLALLALAVACGTQESSDDGDDTPPPDAAPMTGQFSLAWTLSDGAAAAVTCAQVKAESVVVRLVPVVGGPGATASLPCGAGMGTTQPVAAQAYHVDIFLRDADGNTMAMLPRRSNVTLPAGAATALDPAAFTVETTGSLKFTVSAPSAAAANCSAEAMTGAGITAMRVELQTLGMACVATSFDVAAGAMGAATTLAAACPASSASACIERDQMVSATDVPAGDYRLIVEAFEAGSMLTPCYRAAAQFTLAGGVEVDLSALGLVPDAMNMACMAP